MTDEQNKLAADLRATFRERMATRGIWVDSQVNDAFDILIDSIAAHTPVTVPAPAAQPPPVVININAQEIEAQVRELVTSLVARMKDEAAPPAERLAVAVALMDAATPGGPASVVPTPAEPEPPAPAPAVPAAVLSALSPAPVATTTTTDTGRKGRGARGQQQA